MLPRSSAPNVEVNQYNPLGLPLPVCQAVIYFCLGLDSAVQTLTRSVGQPPSQPQLCLLQSGD